jgi:hypothetical protein
MTVLQCALQQLPPRVPPPTAATMRNTQPRPHPPLRLLPQQHSEGDVLDPIAPIGRDAFG